MKTFLEFLYEAEGGSARLSQIRARVKFLNGKIAAGRGTEEDKTEVKKLGQEAADLAVGTQAKISALTNDTPRTQQSSIPTWTSGEPAQVTSSKVAKRKRRTIDPDTMQNQPNVPDPRGHESRVKITGRYGSSYGYTGSGGTGISREGGPMGASVRRNP